jgi:vacuolar-type H+-ATPase subunit I/STV1
LYWLDQLEALINESWRVPLTAKLVLDEDECLNIIDKLRVSIPTEIKKAKRIQQEGQKIVVQGQEDADRIVSLAREQAIRMLDGDDAREQVQKRVNAIIADAQKEAVQIRQGADQYALQVLNELETRITALQGTVRNGISALKTGEGDAADEPA